MRLYLASNNEHKKTEFKRLIKNADVIIPKDIGVSFSPIEDGKTYIDNALIKAFSLYSTLKKPVLADDSGLEVYSLSNRPGLFSSRYGGDVSYEKKCEMLLDEMKDITDRRARFVTALVLVVAERRVFVVEESAEGEIAEKAEGSFGFGYDPIFYNYEAGKISALLEGEIKDLYSHRGKACSIMNCIIERLNLND